MDPRSYQTSHEFPNPETLTPHHHPPSSLAETSISSSRLLALQPELHIQIFNLLSLSSSTCLGLTCKAFYKTHKQLHGTVPLAVVCDNSPQTFETLLGEWAAPRVCRWVWKNRVLVPVIRVHDSRSHEKLSELLEKLEEKMKISGREMGHEKAWIIGAEDEGLGG